MDYLKSKFYHEVVHELTHAHGKMKTAADYCVRHLSP